MDTSLDLRCLPLTRPNAQAVDDGATAADAVVRRQVCSGQAVLARRACQVLVSWAIRASNEPMKATHVNQCGCIPTTRQPAVCATATSYGSSTTGVPAWPGWPSTKLCGPGSPSFPPAPGSTRTRPTP